MGNPFVILYGTDIAGIPVRLAVTVLKSIIINAKMFNLPMDNLNALSKVCGGITISDIVPVNFVVTFQPK